MDTLQLFRAHSVLNGVGISCTVIYERASTMAYCALGEKERVAGCLLPRSKNIMLIIYTNAFHAHF
jgi:hypothetical protein